MFEKSVLSMATSAANGNLAQWRVSPDSYRAGYISLENLQRVLFGFRLALLAMLAGAVPRLCLLKHRSICPFWQILG